jgi:hypothetical protein
MRKIVSAVALLFVFGVAFASKPATAFTGCTCECEDFPPGNVCIDLDQNKLVTCQTWLMTHMC